MKRGQAVIIGIFIFLMVVLAITFYLYYFGAPVTGRVVEERRVTLVEKERLIDNIIFPRSLEVFAVADRTTKEEFEVLNLNDKVVRVSCLFEPLQAAIPASSSCFTYDANGKFVSSGNIAISPGGKHVFTAAVTPFIDVETNINGSRVRVDIADGEYQRNIEMQVWSEDNGGMVFGARIPVRIIVAR